MPTLSDHAASWWNRPVGSQVHVDLVQYTTWLLGQYRRAHQMGRACESIYQGDGLRGYGSALHAFRTAGVDTARLNVVKPVVDTVVARLSKRRPMPQFKVDNADWSLKRKAKRYRQFIVGEMMESCFEELSPMALRDGTIEGTGITRIDDTEDDIFAERVYRDELLIDPRETKYGKPWQVQRVIRIARDVLKDKYPKHKDAIERAPAATRRPNEALDDPDMRDGQSSSLDGYVDVIIAHRRPSFREAENGRVAVVIDGATLRFDEWECERFPYAVFRYAHPTRGYWGRGLVRDLADIQSRINSIVRDVQLNIEAVGKGSYLVNEAFDLPVEMMSGRAPFKFLYKGSQPPQWNAPQAVSGQTLQLLEFFMRQAFELTGVSQAAASSKSALGLNASGVALDTQYDIESERFAMVERQYTQYRLEAAQLYLDAACRVAKARKEREGTKKDRAYVTTWRGRDRIERLEYDEVEMDAEQYRLELEPVSFVPDTRAGKLSAAQELTQAGIIPQWLAASLFDEPDLAMANLINLAPFNNQLRIMEQLGDETKDFIAPEPYHDLAIALKMALAYVNHAEAESAPEEIVSRYRQYVDMVNELKNGIPEPAAAAPPGMDPAMDPAMAGAPMDPAMAGMPPGAPMPPMPPGGGAPMPPEMAGLPMPVAA
jgi:hypothetical protein